MLQPAEDHLQVWAGPGWRLTSTCLTGAWGMSDPQVDTANTFDELYRHVEVNCLQPALRDPETFAQVEERLLGETRGVGRVLMAHVCRSLVWVGLSFTAPRLALIRKLGSGYSYTLKIYYNV